MCKLVRRIVKSIMSLRPTYKHRDDGSRRRQDASVSYQTRETLPMPATSVRSVSRASPTVRNGSTSSFSVSDAQIHTQERIDVECDGSVHQEKLPTLPTKNESVCSRKSGGSNSRDESRSLKDEDPRRHDHMDDGQDSLRGMHHPPPAENNDLHNTLHAHHPTLSPSPSFQYMHEFQARELTTLQRQYQVMLQEKEKLVAAYSVLEHRYQERSKKFDAMRQERQMALDQRTHINEAYAALRHKCQEQAKELNAARQECHSFLEQKHKAEEDFAELRQKYDTQKAEFSTLSHKYHSLRTTLEQRTLELHGVQKFLTTADTFSGAEVVNMLRKLNEEVQQCTTYMAEWAVENFALQTPPADQTITEPVEQTRTSETLGTRLMELLRTRNHNENPILVEMAFRAYLIYSLYWIASPWSIGQEEQSHNVYIDAIYQRMRETEGQAISGNWRALTRAYTLPACISNPELVHTIDTAIMTGFSDVLLAAGCTWSRADMTSTLWAKFAERIHHFVSVAGQVNRTIGVGVISEDYEVLVAWPDATFNDRQMEDSYDSGDRIQGTERQEVVLCATELGLMQRMTVGSRNGEKGKPSEFVVIKPKVALTSVLNLIDE